MTFNRQVLEQVAKDGTTYKSLAKEMALYILGKLPQETPGASFEAFLQMNEPGDDLPEDVIDACKSEGIPLVLYSRTGGTKSGYRTYYIHIMQAKDLP